MTFLIWSASSSTRFFSSVFVYYPHWISYFGILLNRCKSSNTVLFLKMRESRDQSNRFCLNNWHNAKEFDPFLYNWRGTIVRFSNWKYICVFWFAWDYHHKNTKRTNSTCLHRFIYFSSFSVCECGCFWTCHECKHFVQIELSAEMLWAGRSSLMVLTDAWCRLEYFFIFFKCASEENSLKVKKKCKTHFFTIPPIIPTWRAIEFSQLKMSQHNFEHRTVIRAQLTCLRLLMGYTLNPISSRIDIRIGYTFINKSIKLIDDIRFSKFRNGHWSDFVFYICFQSFANSTEMREKNDILQKKKFVQ